MGIPGEKEDMISGSHRASGHLWRHLGRSLPAPGGHCPNRARYLPSSGAVGCSSVVRRLFVGCLLLAVVGAIGEGKQKKRAVPAINGRFQGGRGRWGCP